MIFCFCKYDKYRQYYPNVGYQTPRFFINSGVALLDFIKIKEDYDNKHGAPNAAAPKIFIKYFFVNTKTGEKSGEMLAMVRLDEDAPADGE